MKAGLVGKSVQAQVFKCDQGGVISYSDNPCKAASSKSQTLDLKLGDSTKLQQNQSFAITHYDVRGSTAKEIGRSLAANGPMGFHGLATWKVAYTFKTKSRETPDISRAYTIDLVKFLRARSERIFETSEFQAIF